jgi:hypothetical protein
MPVWAKKSAHWAIAWAVHGLFGVCSLENVGSVRKVQDGGRS